LATVLHVVAAKVVQKDRVSAANRQEEAVSASNELTETDSKDMNGRMTSLTQLNGSDTSSQKSANITESSRRRRSGSAKVSNFIVHTCIKL
jgi:hypothetical protein